ncbi:unnamed protein product, partial [Rotaria sp. Silwood2]
FYHEQSRPDRDSYVKINWENMQTDMRSNFEKYDNTVVNTLNTAYDYASIMHYEKTAFTNNFLPTIEPLQANVKIGQRYKLSSTDIQKIQQFYNCSAAGTLLTTTPTSTIAPSLNPSYYSSEFTINHPIFARNGGFGANYYYETLRVAVPASGLYTFQCNSYIDSFVSLYYINFNSSSPATNLFRSFDDANNDNWEFNFTINFPSAYTMDFAITTYSPSVTGPFQIVATGSNKATFVRISSIASTSTTSTTKLTTTTTTSSTTTTKPTTTSTITTTTTSTITTTTTSTITTTTTSTITATTTSTITTTTKPTTTSTITTTKRTTTTTTKPTTTSTTTTTKLTTTSTITTTKRTTTTTTKPTTTSTTTTTKLATTSTITTTKRTTTTTTKPTTTSTITTTKLTTTTTTTTTSTTATTTKPTTTTTEPIGVSIDIYF